MPIYQYKAYTPGGGTTTGVIDADTAREARAQLRRDQVFVSEINEVRGGRRRAATGKDATKRDRLKAKVQRLRSVDVTPSAKNTEIVGGMTRQLGTLLGAGIPLTEALRALIEQAGSRKAETMMREVRERVSQGTSLADALSEHPGWFTDLYVNMVRAGQATGNLDIVLNRTADYMSSQRALRRKVISALTYPMMMIGIGAIVVSILMGFVVPKITAMLLDTGQTLPVPTQVLIAVSDGFKAYWLPAAILLIIVSFAIERVYARSDRGRLFFDRNMLRVPLIGELLRKQAVSRVTHTLSTLLKSGVPVVTSLEITRNVVGNRVVADATEAIRTRILEGADISTPLKASGAFPPVVAYMVSVGEQSGELEQMLERVGASYDEEITIATERLTSVLEPVMIVLLAIVVGFIVISIVLPILKVGQMN